MARYKVHQAIKKDDPYAVEKALEKIKPQENLRTDGEDFTCIHDAADTNSPLAMQVLLDNLEETADEDTKFKIVNVLESKLERTAAIIAIQKKSYEAFEVLLMDGYVDLQAKDSDGKTVEELCEEDERFAQMLKEYKLYGSRRKRAKDEAERKRLEEEERRLRLKREEEKRQKEEEERQRYEEEKKKREEEEHKKMVEEMERKAQEAAEEEARKKMEEEIERKKKEEEERRK